MAVCRAQSIQMDSMKSLHPATDFSTAHCIDRCNVKTGERISKTVPKTNFSVTSSSRFQRFYVSDEPVPSSYMWREGKLSTIFKDITDAVAKGIDFPHSGRLVVCPLEEVTSRTGWETSSSTDEDVQSSTLNCKKLEHLEVLWGADWFAFFTYILCAYKNSICQRLQKDGNKHLESKLLEVTNVINGLLEAGGCDTTGSDLPTSNFGEWVAKQELFGDKDATVHAVIDYGVHNGASSTLTKRCCENNITHHLTNRLVAFSDGGQESVRDKFAQCVLDEADYEYENASDWMLPEDVLVKYLMVQPLLEKRLTRDTAVVHSTRISSPMHTGGTIAKKLKSSRTSLTRTTSTSRQRVQSATTQSASPARASTQTQQAYARSHTRLSDHHMSPAADAIKRRKRTREDRRHRVSHPPPNRHARNDKMCTNVHHTGQQAAMHQANGGPNHINMSATPTNQFVPTYQPQWANPLGVPCNDDWHMMYQGWPVPVQYVSSPHLQVSYVQQPFLNSYSYACGPPSIPMYAPSQAPVYVDAQRPIPPVYPLQQGQHGVVHQHDIIDLPDRRGCLDPTDGTKHPTPEASQRGPTVKKRKLKKGERSDRSLEKYKIMERVLAALLPVDGPRDKVVCAPDIAAAMTDKELMQFCTRRDVTGAKKLQNVEHNLKQGWGLWKKIEMRKGSLAKEFYEKNSYELVDSDRQSTWNGVRRKY